MIFLFQGVIISNEKLTIEINHNGPLNSKNL